MSLTKFERGNTFKTTVTFTSGSTNIDPSGNKAFLDVYKPDGTMLLQGVSGSRVSTGVYHYYISTDSNDPLGIYIIDWKGMFNYGFPWTYQWKHQKNTIQLLEVED